MMAGAIDQTQLGAALAEQRRYGHPLGTTLVRMGFLDEEALGQALRAGRARKYSRGQSVIVLMRMPWWRKTNSPPSTVMTQGSEKRVSEDFEAWLVR